jgi:hypothetical protein
MVDFVASGETLVAFLTHPPARKLLRGCASLTPNRQGFTTWPVKWGKRGVSPLKKTIPLPQGSESIQMDIKLVIEIGGVGVAGQRELSVCGV